MDIKRILWFLLVCCCGMTAAGQAYRVGDVYTAPDGSQGIVYYLHPDGSGGWVVALHDLPNDPMNPYVAWGEYFDVPGIPNQAYSSYQRANLLYDTAGYANTLAIRSYLGTNSDYAAGIVDFENGWFLPSPAQMIMLMSQKPFISDALVSAGGETLSSSPYWTSAEYSSTEAWCVNGAYSGFSVKEKSISSEGVVRAVRSFTYEPTYVWSTGDSGAMVTVAPEQTMDYTVTVLNPTGCFGEATQTVFVNSLDTTPVVISACESYTWHGVTYDTSGIYPEHYLNVNGCDSMVILNLTIHNPIHQSITATGIESYEWHDSVYTQDGDYLFSHLDANGCTQVDTLHLTIHHGTMTQLDTTVCENDLPIEWGGVVFETAGTHVDTLHTFAGADSLVFWNLHVVQLPVITHSPDTAVLAGDSLTLWAAGSDILTWTDGNGNPVGNGTTVSIRPLTSGYYYVTGYSSGEMVNSNLLVNGDFEQGNTGFFTDYQYVDSLRSNTLGAGNYTITDDAHQVWSSRHQYGYGGSGLFLIADGAGQLNRKVWMQIVDVQPNTDYVLSAHFLSVGDSHLSTADLLFNVNSAQLGPVVHLTDNPNQWQDYAAVWKNTNAATATISLLDTNLLHPGNDFGVDDIRLTPVLYCSVTDSIWVEVLPNPDTMLLTDSACVYYVWYGDTLTQSGIYYHGGMTNWLGYDSVEVLTLTVFPTTYGTFDTTVIENALPLVYNDSIYPTEGTYTQILTNVAGCDSLLVVNVHVHHNLTTDAFDTLCENQLPHIWNDSLFTEAGTKQTTLHAFTGADSTVVMHLTVIPTTYGTVNLGVVENNLPIRYNDSVYEEEGNYIQYLTNVAGCDSILTVNVTVYENVENIADSVICEDELPLIWNDVTFTEAGAQPVVLTASTGADSVLMMIVTVIPTTTFDTSVIACDSFTWRDSIYTRSGDFVSKLPNAAGCDSVVTLHLTVRHSTTYVDVQDVCDSLRWIDGNLYTESTNEPTFTLTNAAGCDSVVNLNLTVRHSTSGIDVQDVCDSLLWIDGILYVESTDEPTYTLTNAAGCDSVVTLNLTVRHSSTGVDIQDVCDSLRWIDGILYVESTNEPTYTLVNASGCDSVVTLNLTVRHSTTYVDVYDVCDSLRWIDGNLYTESTNEPTYTLTNVAGCDSVVTLNLTVRHSTIYVDVQNACDSLRWIDGNLYTESTNGPTFTLTNAAGCDSVVTLHLTITNTDYTDYTDEVCDSLRWIDGNLYTESTNEPTFTLTNAAGCDSVVTLHLTVNHSSTSVDTLDVCDSIRWIDGNLYTESTNEPTFTLTNAAGCDSVVTLHLTVRHSTSTTLNAEIVQNNLPYVLNDSTYTATGTYYQHFTNAAGCDSTVTLNLTVYNNTSAQVYAIVCASALPYTWSGHVFEAAGTFTDTLLTTHGADSVVTYTLTVDNISTTIGNVDHIVCYGDSTGFATAMVTGGQPPMTYAWTNTANTILSTTTTLSSVPAGFYTFTVTDVIGCTAVDTVTIVSLFGEVDPGTISADQVVCSGEQPAPFTGTAATGSDHITYFWEFSSDGEIWSTAQGVYNTQNYTYPYPAPFSFFLRRLSIIQGCGTYYSNVVTVSVWPNTIDTVMGAVCQGEAFEGFGFDITADQIAAPGDYTFEQHHATGHCDSMVVLILTVNPLFETEVEDVVCEGEGYDDNGFSIAPLETVGEEQLTRMLTLQSAAGCDSVVTLYLSVIDTAVRIVSLTPDFCEDLSAELMVVTDMPNYVWSTGETAPTITVTHSGRYYVTATSGECSSTAQFTVEHCDGDQLLLPNAITPSRGDGLNDYFSIPERNLRSINLFEIWIYNRWGELVYYSNDKNFRWNGEYRGQTQYQTVYNYVIRYTDAAGKPYFVKGSVTVL